MAQAPAGARNTRLYLRVGLLILVGAVLAVGFVLFFTAGRLNRNAEVFESYFRESVQGLDVGAAVRYRGVQIGRVTEITLANAVYRSPEGRPFQSAFQLVVVRYAIDTARLGSEDLNIERAVQLGYRTRLASAGLTGGVYLETDFVDPARYPPETLPWTPEHPVVPSMPSTVAQVQDAAQNLLGRLQDLPVEDVLRNVNGLLTDLRAQAKDGDAAQTLHETAELARTLNQAVQGADLPGLVAELRGTATDLRGTLNGRDVRETLRSVREATAQLNAAMTKLPAAIGSLEGTARAARGATTDVNADLAPILRDLRSVTANLRDTTDALRRAPSQAILGSPPPVPAWAQRGATEGRR
ncbi:MlaD family protein [Roseomonas elaeocarpi]|uniref:MlaD family protein n=1 Tax=Roseomonas elaeocarpi TaxID=907779 RepID=A0ABV6JV99_9PROT